MNVERFAGMVLASVLLYGAVACATKLPTKAPADLAPEVTSLPEPDEGVLARVPKDFDSEPRLLKQVAPRYPESARKNRIQGTVVVELVVDEEGTVRWWRVIESVPGLDEAAIECVRQFRFAPAGSLGRR